MELENEAGPIIDVFAEASAEEKACVLKQLQQAFAPPPPAPTEALDLLYNAACNDTGGSQAARSFLFWLSGSPDPTDFRGNGGLELRRLDSSHREAALTVLKWWSGPTASDQPVYGILRSLRERFAKPQESLP